MKVANKLVEIASLGAIALGLVLSARYAVYGDIFFHTDIARDFLVLEEMVNTKKPTLIGPKSGGIPGVFHGPLWFYVSLPIYLIGNGDPSYFAWFWLALVITSVGILYLVASRLFTRKVGFVSAAFLSLASIFYAHNLFNPFGAVLLAPIFIFFLVKYITGFKPLDLILSLFALGFIFQFQMAFAGPIMVLTFPLIVFLAWKNKKLRHILLIPMAFVPMLSFFVFDLRHDFLQTRAVVTYLTKVDETDFELLTHLMKRLDGMLLVGLNFFNASQLLLRIVSSLLAVFIATKALQRRQEKKSLYFLLTLYFYIGYWLVTLLFRGEIWSYYWWPFTPLVYIFIVAGIEVFLKRFSNLILLSSLFVGTVVVIIHVNDYKSFIGNDSGSWSFYEKVATEVYKENNEFGYYVYTPDQFGYSAKYAMNFIGKLDENSNKAHSFEKKQITYLIVAPPPADRPYLDGQWWKAEQVKIVKEPVETIHFDNGYRIEKYELTEDEIAVPADANLIQNLHFR